MIDYAFAVEIYSRYHKHLESIEDSLNKNLSFYNRSREELERLVQFKPQTYTKPLADINYKIKEADIKLSHVVPRMEKLREQTFIMCREHNIEIPKFATKDEAWTS